MDDVSHQIIKNLSLENVTVISLNEFENNELLKVKSTRNKAEYCWTCTPFTILYCLKRYKLDHCTYIDADLYFYADPVVLVNEMQSKSVLITSHNYAPEYDQTNTSGKYCVQFITFKNNSSGLLVLNWWKNACLDWCYARFEDGKFGDQKYLDDWPERFDCVHVLQNFGGGIAPWNTTKYEITKDFCVRDIFNNKRRRVCFYHFHSIKFYDGKMKRGNFLYYKLSRKYLGLLYLPYLCRLLVVNFRLHRKNGSIKLYNKLSIIRLLWKKFKQS
jgi:hypothetical protein